MEVLLVHPNFPGQFRRIAPALAKVPGMRVVGLGDAGWMKEADPFPDQVSVIGYPTPQGQSLLMHPYARSFEQAVRRGEQVIRTLGEYKLLGLEPDVILTHPGWGDAFFLRDFFPGARVLGLFEYFYQPRGADVGFDPEFPSTLDDIFRLKVLNATQLLALESCDEGFAPTAWQRSRFPQAWAERLHVLHEGVDTQKVVPSPTASFRLADGRELRAGDEVLTFVSRNLEPYRGYHIFMRALPEILRSRPNCQVLVVGGDGVSYGTQPKDGVSYREKYLREVADKVDLSRVHFTGTLAYDQYLKVLQVSRAHVYLTYPFILSWSMLEAMSAGCVVIGSATSPVEEVLQDGENGLLVPFRNPEALAKRAIEVLARPGAFAHLGHNARRTIVQRYDFETVSLPAYRKLIEG